MPRLHPSLVLRALGRGLGALLSLVIGVLTRSALGIFTLLLMLYFAVNEPSMAARILGLVSEAIPGEIHARRIAWEPFRGRIHVLGVEISRPGGVPVIRAGRVTTDLRLGALLGHLVSPGEEPLPLIFDQTLVSEAEVNLEFREGKLLLVEAFVPPEASPPPKGRGTLLRMSDIRIEGARVRLEFEERWGVVVRDTTLDGEVRLEDRIITVRTRDLTASRVLLTGDPGLPRALVDAARGLRDLRVSRFQLRDREIDLAGVGIRGTAWELRAGGALAFPRGATRTVAASVALQVPDPEVLEKVTGGAVAGPFEASVVARGPLAAAQLGLSARSPRLEILGVPFDGVVAEARLGLGAPTFLRILALDARTGPGGISGRDLLVHLGSGPDERVRIGGRVDLEGVAGAALVEAFTGTDLEALSPVLAGSLSGRVGLRDLRIGDRAVRGSFSLDLAAGTEPDPRFGLGGAWSVTGELSLDGGGLHTPGLEVLTGEARVALSGALRWSPEPGLDLEGSLEVPGLGRHLAPLGVPGVDGDLSLDRVRVSGSLAHPEVSLAGTVAGLVVPGASGNLEISRLDLSGSPALPRVRLEAAVEGLRTPLLSLARVALDARLEEGSLVVQRLAWEDPLTDGAITGRVYGLVGPGPVIRRSPWRVAVENEAPLRLPLDLVAPEAGIAGDLRVDSFMADGRIGTRARHLLRDLRVASEAEVTGLATPAGGAREARVQLAAEARTAGGRGEPRIRGSVQVQAEGVDVAGVTVEALEASLTAGEVPLRLDWTVPSRVEGDLLLQARGLRRGFLAFRDLDLDLHYPAGEDASIHGRLQVTRGVGARVEGHVARADLRGHAQLRFDGMPLRQIPLPRNAAGAADLVREALVTGQVRLDWPALQPLLDLPTRGLLARLRLAGDLAATRLETLPEPLAGASASLDLQGGRLELRDLRVEHASGATLHGRARLNLEAMTGSGTLRWTPVALRSLRTLAALGLPLDARVGGDLSFRGPLARPHLEADVEIQALEAAGMRLGDAILSVQGDVGDTIRVSSDSFFDGLTLQNEAFLRMDGLDPVSAEADLAFHDLTLARVLPGRELPVTAGVTGSAHLEVGLGGGGERLRGEVRLDAGGLSVEVPAVARLLRPRDAEAVWETGEALPEEGGTFRVVSTEAAELRITEQGLSTDCLRLSTPLGEATLSGGADLERGWDLRVGGVLPTERLTFLSAWLARLEGDVTLGARDACSEPAAALRLAGPLEAPSLSGDLSVDDVSILARGYPHDLVLRSGVLQVAGRLDTGAVAIRIPEAHGLEGQHDEGRFALWGEIDLTAWRPARVELDARGSALSFNVPRQFRLTVSPTLHLSLVHPLDPDRAEGLLKGRVDVTEGRYYRNFDRLLGSFATAFSRSQERYSRPITETVPFLRTVRLELDARSTDFTVASRFPFGETDMEVDVDLKVRGTLDDLELYDRLTLVPGGSITYKVVKREFEVQSGYADFTGRPGRPVVDVKAVTTINRRTQDSSAVMSQTEQIWGRDVNITVHVYGTYPDLRFDLSSDSGEYDQADLQTLLLLGMTRRDLESRIAGEGGGGATINLLTDDVARAVSGLLLSPFVDAVSLGFTQEGGIQAETLTKVGRAIHLTTRVAQDADVSEYTAGFRFMLSDRLFLEGRMKMQQDDLKGTNQNYEGRLLYRIPLE